MAAGLSVAASPFGGSAHCVPRVGLDVEATHVLANGLAPVRIGFIRAKRPWKVPADKFVCQVEVAPAMCGIVAVRASWKSAGEAAGTAGTDLPTGDSIHEEISTVVCRRA
jgi:hypothetical protein